MPKPARNPKVFLSDDPVRPEEVLPHKVTLALDGDPETENPYNPIPKRPDEPDEPPEEEPFDDEPEPDEDAPPPKDAPSEKPPAPAGVVAPPPPVLGSEYSAPVPTTNPTPPYPTSSPTGAGSRFCRRGVTPASWRRLRLSSTAHGRHGSMPTSMAGRQAPP